VASGKTRRIKDVLDDDENMSVASVTAICYQLANYLRFLHESSVCIDELSETNTFIRYGKKNVSVIIYANPNLNLYQGSNVYFTGHN
jgi:hypothetical protein